MKPLHSKVIDWFWPVVAFASPWALWPFEPHNAAQSYVTHYVFSYIVIFSWFIITYKRYNLKTVNRRSLYNFAKNYPHLAAMLAFSVWTLVASALAPQPIVSLTGNLITYRDAALHYPALAMIAVLVTLHATRDARLPVRVAKAAVASGVLFAVAGILEIVLRKGFFYDTGGNFATVLFAAPGHLAGFLALATGVASGLTGLWRWIPIAVLAFGIGMTTNRTAIGAAILPMLVNLKSTWWDKVKLLSVFLALVVLGWTAYHAKTDRFREDFTKARTLETRVVFWRIALDGIAARPLTGWGGGQYVLYMSQVADANDLAYMLFENDTTVRDIVYKSDDFYLFETFDGARGARRVIDWSPHNLLLDISLSWGIVGLALYLLILFYTVPPALSGNPASLGILAYHLFLLLWLPSVEASEVLWMLFGLAGLRTAAWPSQSPDAAGAAPTTET